MEPSVILTTPKEIEKIMLQTLEKFENLQKQKRDIQGTVSINKAAKIIGCSHATAVKLIRDGVIKTTSDQRRISLTELNRYLGTI
jgi:hypothetical protein